MKKAIVRFGSLYVFNVVVLLLIGLLLPNVRVGWNALWASVVLTLGALLLKPVLMRAFRRVAAKSAGSRTRVGEKVVQYALVFVVELIIWMLTVWFSGVDVRGWFWGYILPPVILLIGWMIYDVIDDRVEARAGEVYERVSGGRAARGAGGAPGRGTAPEAPAATAGRQELKDGLTPEQRKLLDEL